MEWESVEIKDIALGIYDGPHATPKESEDGPIFLGITELNQQGGIDLSSATHLSEEDFLIWTRRVTPKANDIVFSYEASLHRYAIIPNELRCCLGRRLALIRVDDSMADYKFVYYSLLSPAWKNQVQARIIAGATVERIPLIDFPNFKLKLPPLPLQQRIAEVLGRYDALIENYQRQIGILESLAQALYREQIKNYELRIMNETGALPVGWKRVQFTDIVSIQSGGTPKTDNPQFWDGDIFWFSPADLENSFYVLSTDKTISESGLKSCNSKLYPANTVIITARGTVGRCVLLGKPMAINQSNYALIGRSVSQYFVFFKSLELADRWKQEAIGAVFETITVNNFERTEIVLPSTEVLETFDKVIEPILNKIRICLEQIELLRTMRDKLLPRLLSGQIELSSAAQIHASEIMPVHSS